MQVVGHSQASQEPVEEGAAHLRPAQDGDGDEVGDEPDEAEDQLTVAVNPQRKLFCCKGRTAQEAYWVRIESGSQKSNHSNLVHREPKNNGKK